MRSFENLDITRSSVREAQIAKPMTQRHGAPVRCVTPHKKRNRRPPRGRNPAGGRPWNT